MTLFFLFSFVYFLLVNESGIFLLRFSDSKPGQIAISYTDYAVINGIKQNKLIISHCLIDAADGLLSLTDTQRQYSTLKDLLTDCKRLKKFYPDLTKQRAFRLLDRLQERLAV